MCFNKNRRGVKDMMNLPYFLYMAEAEGVTEVVNTRQARLNAIIRDYIALAEQGININDMEVQNYLAQKYDLEDLTAAEKHEIARAVMNQL
jgi:hypothetical protein